jgi:alkanesulfonate monooxygenase SsuD/methylene tetrahydromethanopterin reductase-like flavin-dependent oxidoreductase (luciferase family)
MCSTMRFGIDLPTTGDYADVRLLADLAGAAEKAGWDGFFVYDQVASEQPEPLVDPWIALAAVALATSSLRFGPLVTPLARRRPWKVAREAATLDRLSGGRMVLGVGLGAGATEFDDLGDAGAPRQRAAMLDEGLAILAGLWRGEPFDFAGQHYKLQRAHFLPTPQQQPRIPIWVGGIWPNLAPMRRAAAWDGVFPHFRDGMMPAAELARLVDYVASLRAGDTPFDVVLRNKLGDMPANEEAALVTTYARAGLTWWLVGTECAPTVTAMYQRIRRGPPRSSRLHQ